MPRWPVQIMADSKVVTGNTDDLVVDFSRCLRMRFSENSCQHCADICPQGAITRNGSLAINPEQCNGCLLCTTVCPVGAIEQNSDFSVCLEKLSRVPEPILGCIRTKECSNANLACLGGLSEEHLLALYHSLTGRLTLNLSLCGDCPNMPIITRLHERLDALSEAGLVDRDYRFFSAESAQDVHYCDEPVGRRSFFRSFGDSLFKSAEIILSTTNTKNRQYTGYAEKRLPERRELLNSIRIKLPLSMRVHFTERFDSIASFNGNCTACQGCVAICPTGALQTERPDTNPVFDHMLCTGCNICEEFCLDDALKIERVC